MGSLSVRGGPLKPNGWGNMSSKDLTRPTVLVRSSVADSGPRSLNGDWCSLLQLCRESTEMKLVTIEAPTSGGSGLGLWVLRSRACGAGFRV